MRKWIRVLAILAEVLAMICLGLVICTMVFQTGLMQLYTKDMQVLEQFVIPVGAIGYGVCLMVLLVLPIIASWRKKPGIWLEIVTACLLPLLPAVQSGLNALQTVLLGRFGVNTIAALSIVQNVCRLPLAVGSVAAALALVTCGMSIAYKKMQ